MIGRLIAEWHAGQLASWSLFLRRYWRSLMGRCWRCNCGLDDAELGNGVYRRWPNRHCCYDCNKTLAHAQNYSGRID